MTIGIMLIILGLILIFAEVLIPSGGIISILAVGSFISEGKYCSDSIMMAKSAEMRSSYRILALGEEA